uniref:Uncharacterized protein n=1 Tax=Setaria viridis TaxID=4556 RepID=A0A4U6VW76_SETVI|nr:hypothetical protein SEVIR_2G292300v2 [Setaria viridis]
MRTPPPPVLHPSPGRRACSAALATPPLLAPPRLPTLRRRALALELRRSLLRHALPTLCRLATPSLLACAAPRHMLTHRNSSVTAAPGGQVLSRARPPLRSPSGASPAPVPCPHARAHLHGSTTCTWVPPRILPVRVHHRSLVGKPHPHPRRRRASFTPSPRALPALPPSRASSDPPPAEPRGGHAGHFPRRARGTRTASRGAPD